MTKTAGKRRSLLATAIDSIGPPPLDHQIDKGEEASNTIASLPNPPVSPSSTGFLERRGIAFDEIARSVKRLTIRLKPSECSIWPGNARDYSALSYERCESLIESIREEGTNREPVVVRRTNNSPYPYELIVGTRRHFSISWLHANNHTEIELVARIETLDDEGAFRLADIENREREDVTDLERARNYQHAVDAYYKGVRTQMADRLAISKQNLHNLLQLAELPDEIIAAFADPVDLKVRHGMRLAPLLKDPRYRASMIAEAIAIQEEQKSLKYANRDSIPGVRVCERLIKIPTLSNKAQSPRKPHRALTTLSGREIGYIVSDTRSKGLTININPKGNISLDDMLQTLRATLEKAQFKKL